MIWVTDEVALTAGQPLDDRTWLVAAQEIEPTDESWYVRATALCALVP